MTKNVFVAFLHCIRVYTPAILNQDIIFILFQVTVAMPIDFILYIVYHYMHRERSISIAIYLIDL